MKRLNQKQKSEIKFYLKNRKDKTGNFYFSLTQFCFGVKLNTWLVKDFIKTIPTNKTKS